MSFRYFFLKYLPKYHEVPTKLVKAMNGKGLNPGAELPRKN